MFFFKFIIMFQKNYFEYKFLSIVSIYFVLHYFPFDHDIQSFFFLLFLMPYNNKVLLFLTKWYIELKEYFFFL